MCTCGPLYLSRYSDTLGLDDPEIESQWGARLSAPVQTCPGAHPASYTMVAGLFSGGKRPRLVINHPYPPSAEVLWTFDACSRLSFTFILNFVEYCFGLYIDSDEPRFNNNCKPPYILPPPCYVIPNISKKLDFFSYRCYFIKVVTFVTRNWNSY